MSARVILKTINDKLSGLEKTTYCDLNSKTISHQWIVTIDNYSLTINAHLNFKLSSQYNII